MKFDIDLRFVFCKKNYEFKIFIFLFVNKIIKVVVELNVYVNNKY